MSLAYNQACPAPYQPSGFVDKDDFQEGDAQAMCDYLTADTEDVVGMLETSHHQVRVTVRLANLEAQDSSVDFQDTEMSKQLQAMQKTSSSQSDRLLSTLKGSTPAAKRRTDAPIPSGKRMKATGPRKPSNHNTAPRVTRASAPKSSQSLGIPIVAGLESVGQKDLTVKSVAGTMDSPKGTDARLAVTKLAELLVHCYAVQKAKTVDGGDLFDEDLLAEGHIKRLSRSINISCECGSRKESSGMVSIGTLCCSPG